MTSLAIADRTINVPFYGNSLFVVEHNGEAYTPMKPIVEGMGLDWKSQHKKISQRFYKGMVEITIPSVGGIQSMICLALRKLAAWLNSISPNKVRPEIRDNVIRYQEECDDVLYEYWTKGEVKNPRKKTTVDERTPLRDAVNMLVSKRHMMYPEAYAMIHQRFNVESIEDLEATQIPDAIEYVHRVALEGEFLGKQEALPAPKLDIHYPADWWDQFPLLQRERKIQKSTAAGGYQFPVRLLYGFEDESPSAISSLISKLAMQGYDVSAVKMEYLAHRHYAERMYQKLSRVAEISGSVLGSSITLNIQTPMRS
ncbi:antirepressor protein Ant [Klebsiella pneumoniae]|uniref:phage antirepressor N-terminal domain-containing protein n=1 Tax=Klebsiella pneumoniae TaxID=573 RepID=UPI0011BA46CF|nr:phage antirepressor N-terminal domain-containing protein [Klebsiella pneumoniae]QWA86224.1 phage antirepressor N-terminal domain-containing protein [Klebsiella pneumoniae]TWY47502.1 antirepressor protein Ant [Klebsiella pneumoniae]TWY58227.1 antirepressor protein Ant [Klebsiella pneumoniae]TWY61368.1 antirepressor protein Ant [Klebsiella pneumoniae]TWY86702.1 antirepressor protein Ant [Klebsiella pneumoniae]